MKVINLLPKSKQAELRYDALLNSFWLIVIFSIISFGLVFLAQFGAKFYLQLQSEEIKNEIAQLKVLVNKQENASVKAKVKGINDLVSDYKNLADNSPKWSKVIKAFAPLPPDGVKINGFSIDTRTASISITGVSPTRELVILLYNNILNDSQDFYNINYPLENIVSPTNNNFHFSFYIQKKLFK